MTPSQIAYTPARHAALVILSQRDVSYGQGGLISYIVAGSLMGAGLAEKNGPVLSITDLGRGVIQAWGMELK
jgi:hypothetical protein